MIYYIVALISTLVCGGEEIPTFEQAFGALSPVEKVKRWSDRYEGGSSASKFLGRRLAEESAYSGDYFAARIGCNFSMEVSLVVDTSVELFVEAMKNQDLWKEGLSTLDAMNHLNSKFSLSSFTDRPFQYANGTAAATCFNNHIGLTADASALVSAALQIQPVTAVPNLFPYMSNQLEAINKAITWSNKFDSQVRLVILLTATSPHFNLDGLNIYNKPQYNADQQDSYYPGPQLTLQYIEDSQTYLMVVLNAGALYAGIGFVNYLWLMFYLSFNAAFVKNHHNPLLFTQADFNAYLTAAVNIISEIECSPDLPIPTLLPTTTTTPAPTAAPTEAPTTPAPTEAPTTTPAPTEAPTTTPAPTEAPTTTPAPTEAPTTTPAPTEAPTTPAPTEAPTTTPAPTEAPTTPAPTEAPTTTPAPTEAPTTTPAPTEAPTTPAPTEAPTTPAPTEAPTTPAPTEAPTTPAPTTQAPTTTPAPTEAPTTTPAPTTTVAPTTVAPITTPAQTTPAPTTTTPAPTSAPEPTVTPAGTTEGEKECGTTDCYGNGVMIALKEQPKQLELVIKN